MKVDQTKTRKFKKNRMILAMKILIKNKEKRIKI
jgi:hypothetical protein